MVDHGFSTSIVYSKSVYSPSLNGNIIWSWLNNGYGTILRMWWIYWKFMEVSLLDGVWWSAGLAGPAGYLLVLSGGKNGRNWWCLLACCPLSLNLEMKPTAQHQICWLHPIISHQFPIEWLVHTTPHFVVWNQHSWFKYHWNCFISFWFLSYNWLVVYLPLWKMMDFVSWDDDIPNWMEEKKHVPNHQPDMIIRQKGVLNIA